MSSPREIHWFSGSGNSRYVAGRLGALLGGGLLQRMTEAPPPAITSSELGLVFPVHSFRVPIMVRRWLERADLSQVRSCWAVLTMGGSGLKVWEELRQLLEAKRVTPFSLQKVVTPDCCLYLYPANSCKGPAVTDPILDKAEDQIVNAAQNIRNQVPIPRPEKKHPLLGAVMSDLLGSLFLRSIPKAKRPWRATDACGACGNCAALCPSGNIRMELDANTGKKRPVWGTNCVVCMACIEWCPEKAIEYGKATMKRGRYHHRAVTPGEMKSERRVVEGAGA